MKTLEKLFAALLLSLSLTIAACAQTEKPDIVTPGEKAPEAVDVKDDKITEKIGEDTLVLQNSENKCRMLFNEQKIELDLAWQCNFHRFPDGKIRAFPQAFYNAQDKSAQKQYRDTQIILIESSQPLTENPKECRTELQAVKIVKGKLTKSVKMDGLAACPPFQWDEKNFVGLF